MLVCVSFKICYFKDEMVGIVELVEIDYIHRRAEFQIIIDPIARFAMIKLHASQDKKVKQL